MLNKYTQRASRASNLTARRLTDTQLVVLWWSISFSCIGAVLWWGPRTVLFWAFLSCAAIGLAAVVLLGLAGIFGLVAHLGEMSPLWWVALMVALTLPFGAMQRRAHDTHPNQIHKPAHTRCPPGRAKRWLVVPDLLNCCGG